MEEQMLKNIQEVQKKNDLLESQQIERPRGVKLGYNLTRKKKIILFPDLSEHMESYLEREIGEDFRDRNYDISTSTVLEDLDISVEDRKAGLDLRDYLVQNDIITLELQSM